MIGRTTERRGGSVAARLRAVRDDDRGASLVEFAMVAVLLFTLMFGIIEFGFVFRDRLTIANSAQSAARVGAAMGSDPQADISTLTALEESLSTLPNSGIGIVRYVDIFKARADGNPDGGCPGPNCTRYTYFPGFTATCDWSPCPEDPTIVVWTGRDDALPDLDVLGLRLGFAHNWMTDFLPMGDVTCPSPGVNCWTESALMRIEPQVFAP